VVTSEEFRLRKNTVKETRFGEDVPDGRKFPQRLLDGTIGKDQLASDDTCLGMGIHEMHGFRYGPILNFGVRIQEKDVISTCNFEALIVRRRKADVVRILNQFGLLELRTDPIRRPVGRSVIDDNQFKIQVWRLLVHRSKALTEHLPRVHIHNDDRQLHDLSVPEPQYASAVMHTWYGGNPIT
jgi:hypothetical protein